MLIGYVVAGYSGTMRVLHTADLHLREDDAATINALEELLSKAEEHEVDILTISGDIFHTAKDANALRPQIRSLFSDNPFDILAIPGNHDADVYEENLDFGQDIDVLVNKPTTNRSYDDAEFIGVPYTEELTDDLFSTLSSTEETDQTQFLLLHCTLDIGFSSSDVGEEDSTEYFPVTKSVLAKLGYDYVLAGHIHATVREVPLSNGGEFIYPGSPISHSTKETGRRHAVLIDTEEDRTRSIPLDTYYFDRFTETVRPGEEGEVIQSIQRWVDQRDDEYSELQISVDGFIDQEETEFQQSLNEAAGTASVTNETREVSDVLEHPLYQQFRDELEEEEDLADKDAVRTRVIQVLSRLLAGREIRP
jgi:DNA repair exonuclease SbcCD nuclease subunit